MGMAGIWCHCGGDDDDTADTIAQHPKMGTSFSLSK